MGTKVGTALMLSRKGSNHRMKHLGVITEPVSLGKPNVPTPSLTAGAAMCYQ